MIERASLTSNVVRPDIRDWVTRQREPAPIVRLPVGEAWEQPEPAPVARAEMTVKVFRDRQVDEERYTAILHAHSDSPAALLAALAGAVGEHPELHADSEPDERLIMQISIRR